VLLAAGAVLTGQGLLRPGWIEVADGAIAGIGEGVPPRPADRDLGATTVVPGFVDTHVHGGGGASLSEGGAQTETAAALHRRHGTTTLVASLVTESPPDLLEQVSRLTDAVRSGVIAGIHLEGPWLAE
jgi:N-acetylglucosamine-6-phosphate deacetylase